MKNITHKVYFALTTVFLLLSGGFTNGCSSPAGGPSGESSQSSVAQDSDPPQTGEPITQIALASLNGGDINSDGTVDGLKLNGVTGVGVASLSDRFGDNLKIVGDVNSDGFDDLLIGAPQAEPTGQTTADNRGEAYLFFGKSTANFSTMANGTIGFSTASLNAAMGFTLVGHSSSQQLGRTLAGGQDFNNDNVADFLLGLSALNPSQAYIFTGQSGLAVNSLNDGVLIEGVIGASTFISAASGDIDNDGVDDILIGNSSGDIGAGSLSGVVHLVFGQADSGLADLGPLNGDNGTSVLSFGGVSTTHLLGRSISGIGDIDSDGFDDLAMGGNNKVYVIFGDTRANLATLSNRILNRSHGYTSGLDSLNGSNGGFIINQPLFSSTVSFGVSLTEIGDFNGDSRDDFAIGATAPGTNGITNFVYVIYGQAAGFTNINLSSTVTGSSLGFQNRGFTIFGLIGGVPISRAGDFNADGFDDLVIGSPNGNRAMVVFGSVNIAARLSVPHAFTGNSSNALVMDLSNGSNSNGVGASPQGEGFQLLNGGQLEGAGVLLLGPSGFTGYAVTGGGDLNNDGFDDLAISSPTNSVNSFAGQTFIVFGQPFIAP